MKDAHHPQSLTTPTVNVTAAGSEATKGRARRRRVGGTGEKGLI